MLKRILQTILLGLFSNICYAGCNLSASDVEVMKIYRFIDKSPIESLKHFNLESSEGLEVGIPKDSSYYSENIGTDERPLVVNIYENDNYELHFTEMVVNALPTINLVNNNYFDVLISIINDFRKDNTLSCKPKKIANYLALTSLIVHSGSKYIEVFSSKTENVIVWYHEGDWKDASFIIKTKYNDRILIGGVLEKEINKFK